MSDLVPTGSLLDSPCFTCTFGSWEAGNAVTSSSLVKPSPAPLTCTWASTAIEQSASSYLSADLVGLPAIRFAGPASSTTV